MSSVLNELGIDLSKLQEIPLDTDPDQQALERFKQDALMATMVRWMDLHADARKFAPVLMQCGFCEDYFSQFQISWKPLRAVPVPEFTQPAHPSLQRPLVMALAGFPACAVDRRRPVKEWLDKAKARQKERRRAA
jgi:hypothetical protein